jgi:hypothetical protein
MTVTELHEFGQFESIQAGHLHIDKRQRHIVREQELKRLIASANGKPEADRKISALHRLEPWESPPAFCLVS